MRSRSAAAVSIWPRWPRKAWMRGSNGASDPRAASVDRAPLSSADWNSRSASNNAASAYAAENCVPLSSARPSFGPSASGARPASARATSEGRRRPSKKTSPTPIIAAAMWASGARSPDAPTDPCTGTTGVTPRASIVCKRATVSRCTPEAPWARLPSFRAIISRTIGVGVASPTPAACESTMLRCSLARSASAMRTLASLPKPVFTP